MVLTGNYTDKANCMNDLGSPPSGMDLENLIRETSNWHPNQNHLSSLFDVVKWLYSKPPPDYAAPHPVFRTQPLYRGIMGER